MKKLLLTAMMLLSVGVLAKNPKHCEDDPKHCDDPASQSVNGLTVFILVDPNSGTSPIVSLMSFVYATDLSLTVVDAQGATITMSGSDLYEGIFDEITVTYLGSGISYTAEVSCGGSPLTEMYCNPINVPEIPVVDYTNFAIVRVELYKK